MFSYASAASIFIPPKNTPGRMALCVTTLLSLVTLFNGARSHWTETSYLRAIDFWVIGCYIGMFFALMEYIAILHLLQIFTSDGQTNIEVGNQNHRKMVANATEKITKFLLPLYNIVFPVVYFMICTSHGADYW